MFQSSIIELSKSAFKNNLKFLKSVLHNGAEYCSVIKGNAYGHGINVFLPLAESCGVRHFAVFDADEALRAVKCRCEKSDLMIMGAIDDAAAVEWAIENNVSFYIFENQRLQCAIDAAERVGKPARIHLEVETGLNRMGLQDTQIDNAIDLIKHNADKLELEGLCTHYAGAESIANYVRIQKQLETYTHLSKRLKLAGLTFKHHHTACSAAVLRYPETHMDLVRVGIAQYGFWPTKETEMDYHLRQRGEQPKPNVSVLRRVLRWSSRVMSIKNVGPGEFIGYGNSYMTEKKQKLAAVPVGYFHGFSRGLSNLGMVLVRGRRAPVVGLVNMNMVMVDVSHVPEVGKGDEVVIIGKQKKAQIDVASFSDLSRVLNYEILVRLPSEIPRVVVR